MKLQDGSATFALRDKRLQAIVDLFYPVGTIYISADGTKTKEDFEFMKVGTWEEVSANLCLQTAKDSDEVGKTRSAGLPNLKGFFDTDNMEGTAIQDSVLFKSTVISTSGTSDNKNNRYGRVTFDASRYSSIYGSSNTVQPPAYMVKAWRRVS